MRINDEWSITWDELQYTIHQTRPTKPSPRTKSATITKAVAYFTTAPSALKWLLEKKVKTSEVRDFQKIVDVLEKFKVDIDDAMGDIPLRLCRSRIEPEKPTTSPTRRTRDKSAKPKAKLNRRGA